VKVDRKYRITFCDRLGDTFRWKGENVSTNEVGDTISQAPGVQEANVYGVQIPGKQLACLQDQKTKVAVWRAGFIQPIRAI